MVRSHEANVRNWAFGLRGMGTATPFAESGMRRLVRGNGDDTLYSYGTHFPLVRLIRTRSGKPSHWLINGDTWGGGWSMTSAHQDAVRSVIGGFAETLGMPHVIVPQSVLDAAGIDTATLQIVDVSEEWWENRVEEFEAEPEGSYWIYETTTLPGTGVRISQRTGEVFTPGWDEDRHRHVYDPPGRPKYGDFTIETGLPDDLAERQAERARRYERYLAAERRWQLEWEEIPRVEKRTGRRYLVLNRRSGQPLEQYQREDGTIGSRYSWRRHWLGESLIKGRVPYASTATCWRCGGTGEDEWREPIGGCLGPLNEDDSRRMDEHEERRRRTWPDPDYLAARQVQGIAVHPQCRTCGGSKRIRATKHRWAYFLSGFDHNEPRPSYFFSELPPKVKPKTVAEAYLTLKPQTVRLAEEMGRTVLRQGDQWFIEMPGLTLRELKKDGGRHFTRGGPGRERQQFQPENPQHWQIPRFQRFINMDCWLHGTTHEATEVVRVGALTYARGIVRHVPDQRAPDHIPLPLGDRKTWFLCIPNGTPTGA